MKKNKKENNSKIRRTKAGTQVVLGEKLCEGIYLCQAITRNGNFTTQIDVQDLV